MFIDLLFYAHVEIHRVSRLVFDKYQRCPVSLSSPLLIHVSSSVNSICNVHCRCIMNGFKTMHGQTMVKLNFLFKYRVLNLHLASGSRPVILASGRSTHDWTSLKGVFCFSIQLLATFKYRHRV